MQRFLAHAGLASRRKAEELILSGAVSVNGKTVTELGTKVFPARDRVTFRGRVVHVRTARIFLYHKPMGVLTTMSDPQGRPCVGDVVAQMPLRLFPVGRLDLNVTGLLILTNDGELAQKLLHPRFEAPRVYLARTSGVFSDQVVAQVKRGIAEGKAMLRATAARRLKSELRWTRLVGIPREGEEIVEVTVREGSKHFVKRLLAAAGCPVVRLCRIAFGPFTLGNLGEGEMREVPVALDFLDQVP